MCQGKQEPKNLTKYTISHQSSGALADKIVHGYGEVRSGFRCLSKMAKRSRLLMEGAAQLRQSSSRLQQARISIMRDDLDAVVDHPHGVCGETVKRATSTPSMTVLVCIECGWGCASLFAGMVGDRTEEGC